MDVYLPLSPNYAQIEAQNVGERSTKDVISHQTTSLPPQIGSFGTTHISSCGQRTRLVTILLWLGTFRLGHLLGSNAGGHSETLGINSMQGILKSASRNYFAKTNDSDVDLFRHGVAGDRGVGGGGGGVG